MIWSDPQGEVRIRVAEPGERVRGIRPSTSTFIQLAKRKIEHWVATESLPYAPDDLSARSNEWWRHLSKLLVHNVRLSPPRAIDCVDVDKEIDLLYEAVVSPIRERRERTSKIDKQLTKALGPMEARLIKGSGVAGFEGHIVPVHRFKEDEYNLLVIEGVNLAGATAEQDADALVSRLLRIKERQFAKKIIACVGYLTSPSGLNGEAFLINWIRTKAGAETFDLVKQETFASQVERELSRLRTN